MVPDNVVGGREHKRTTSQWLTVPLASQRQLVIHSHSHTCRQLVTQRCAESNRYFSTMSAQGTEVESMT